MELKRQIADSRLCTRGAEYRTAQDVDSSRLITSDGLHDGLKIRPTTNRHESKLHAQVCGRGFIDRLHRVDDCRIEKHGNTLKRRDGLFEELERLGRQ